MTKSELLLAEVYTSLNVISLLADELKDKIGTEKQHLIEQHVKRAQAYANKLAENDELADLRK